MKDRGTCKKQSKRRISFRLTSSILYGSFMKNKCNQNIQSNQGNRQMNSKHRINSRNKVNKKSAKNRFIRSNNQKQSLCLKMGPSKMFHNNQRKNNQTQSKLEHKASKQKFQFKVFTFAGTNR